MQKIKIAATGLDGLVGSRIFELLSNDFEFIDLNKKVFDITDIKQVNHKIKTVDFDIFLHLAAYTNVDLAETQKSIAWDINVLGTKNIFNAVKNKGRNMIHISTDFVFDGTNPPYDEKCIPQPQSYYGITKYEAEGIVKNHAMIVRISYPYRAKFEPKKDIIRNIITILKSNKIAKGITDQYLTPTYIDDIAYGLKYLVNHFRPETYHLVGPKSYSGFDMVSLICDIFGYDKALIEKITYQEFYQGRAKRPQKGIIISNKNNFWKMKTLEQAACEIIKNL